MFKNKILHIIFYTPRYLAQGLIKIYQKTISLDHGPLAKYMPYPTCKYHPTCSEYGYQAIGLYGIIKGGLLTLWRILRCNPWSKGGYDPVPQPTKKIKH